MPETVLRLPAFMNGSRRTKLGQIGHPVDVTSMVTMRNRRHALLEMVCLYPYHNYNFLYHVHRFDVTVMRGWNSSQASGSVLEVIDLTTSCS